MTLLAAPHVGAQIVPQEGDLVLLGGVLWDGTSDASRPNPGILIRNGTILTVGRVDAAGSGADVMSLGDDAFIMPGLFDLHAHYAVDLFAEGRVDEYTVNPVLFLANGVTSTFPAGEVDPDEARTGRMRRCMPVRAAEDPRPTARPPGGGSRRHRGPRADRRPGPR